MDAQRAGALAARRGLEDSSGYFLRFLDLAAGGFLRVGMLAFLCAGALALLGGVGAAETRSGAGSSRL